MQPQFPLGRGGPANVFSVGTLRVYHRSMAMKLYAEKPVAFVDDADFVTNQKLVARATFELREPRTIRVHVVAVDANDVRVTPTGSIDVTPVESIKNTALGADSGDVERLAYLETGAAAATATLGTELAIALGAGTWALRFTNDATLPASAKLRIYVDSGPGSLS